MEIRRLIKAVLRATGRLIRGGRARADYKEVPTNFQFPFRLCEVNECKGKTLRGARARARGAPAFVIPRDNEFQESARAPECVALLQRCFYGKRRYYDETQR